MATLTIRNIPDDLYEKLKETAKTNRRSLNSEVIYIIERAFSSHRLEPAEIIASAREIRETLDLYVTEEDLNRAKNEGRP